MNKNSKENYLQEDNLNFNYPINAQIEVTESCNHSCFYCYNYWKDDKSKTNKISPNKTNQLMDIVFEEIKPFEIVITGGEPLENLPAILIIGKRLRDKHISYTLNTNLSLMNEKNLEKILSVNENIGILASLPHYIPNCFENIVGKKTLNKILNNLEKVLAKNVDLTINMVTHKMNYQDVYNEGKFLVENFGIKSFCATPALKPPLRKNFYDLYLSNKEITSVLNDLLKLKEDFNIKIGVLEAIPPCSLPEHLRKIDEFRRGCSAGRTTIQISPVGEVRSCGQSPIIVGNIFKEKFSDIWERFKPFRENKYIPDECKECAELSSCNGGCRWEGYQLGNPFNKKDSRMTQKLNSRTLISLDKIDPHKTYKVRLFGYRKEEYGKYVLYNGKTIIVNEQMKEFILGIKKEGFRLMDFPKELRKKAEYIGRKLLTGGFLVNDN